ncbi:probable beta-D-xylosidase 5 [Physcomitrium patens]|uniref:Fibronectin type III-like domain-containing protein n=1 Tax=Physcomitrium patens TaxID=3218 RepID=A0A2K1IG41_PHYPA|nr:probable beta-D-xylosidase 5 [Physcomitrium patens]PNR28237.1 hypothetical protein PHYPA_028829 [Physcomitrium patens]|eukprot:XP_024364102.1 probable beta-D-xylosidase 5 [Physcomitrella patens]
MKSTETVILACILLGVMLLTTQLFEKPRIKVYKLQYACDPDGPADLLFPFCNTSISDDDRVEDLISRLTIQEKIEQLVNTAANVSRLGIPPYQWWGEGLHGVAISPSVYFGGATPAATSFPLPCLSVCSYNRTLWNKIGQVVSTEGRAMYNQGRSGLTYWSPNINIARDPRWGRTQETPGEDPKLSSGYAVHFVKGLQEGDYDQNQPQAVSRGPRRLKISACCKHFTAHDLDRWKDYDRDHFDSKVTQQDLEDTYNPSFKSCVKEGQSSSVMCSYNRLNGIPMCTHYELLTLTVRNQWGFDGYIVSDCDAVALIHDYINYAPTSEDAVSYVMLAGMDLNCGSTTLVHGLAALDKKLIWEGLIDMHLRNLFRVRMRLGMFDGNPSTLPYGSLGPEDMCTEDNQHLALEAARQSLVLLKNEKNALPWKKTHGLKLAVIGHHADATREMLGNYEGYPCKFVSPLQGFAKVLSDHSPRISHERGCSDAACEDQFYIYAAKEAAAQADAVVLVLGISQAQEKEGRDRDSLLLPGRQMELVSSVVEASAGRPVVLVLLSGSPLDVSFANDDPRIQSIIWAGYPGQSGGEAIAEAIFGLVNPGGRLAQSWYYENYTNIDMSNMNMRPNASTGYPGRTYRFFTDTPLWEFGHGLSYSDFKYTMVSAPQSIMAPHLRYQLCSSDRAVMTSDLNCLHYEKEACKESSFHVRVWVINHGPLSGDHSVLLFSKPPSRGIDGIPLKQLVSFERVHLEAGAGQEILFKVNPCEDLGTVGDDGIRTVELGEHTLMVGMVQHVLTVENWREGHGEL